MEKFDVKYSLPEGFQPPARIGAWGFLRRTKWILGRQESAEASSGHLPSQQRDARALSQSERFVGDIGRSVWHAEKGRLLIIRRGCSTGIRVNNFVCTVLHRTAVQQICLQCCFWK